MKESKWTPRGVPTSTTTPENLPGTGFSLSTMPQASHIETNQPWRSTRASKWPSRPCSSSFKIGVETLGNRELRLHDVAEARLFPCALWEWAGGHGQWNDNR
ncbi:hypothetical protein Q1695_007913 [Nippostrongylus brasiliensis]|nr:hypothetical protein Q1695_007913 [Nippostrongylus brasiliensis]